MMSLYSFLEDLGLEGEDLRCFHSCFKDDAMQRLFEELES